MAPQSNEQLKTRIKELGTANESLQKQLEEADKVIGNISNELGYEQEKADVSLTDFLKNILSEKTNENSDSQSEILEDLQGKVVRLSKELEGSRALEEKTARELVALQQEKPATARPEGKIQLVLWNYSDYQRPIAHIAFKVGKRANGQIILPNGIECKDGFNCPVKINKEDMGSLTQYLDKNGIGYKEIK